MRLLKKRGQPDSLTTRPWQIQTRPASRSEAADGTADRQRQRGTQALRAPRNDANSLSTSSRSATVSARPMSPSQKKFLQSWLINTIAVLIAAQIVHGIRYDSTAGLIIATLLLGVLNAFLRPLLLLLSLPLVVVTLGLFIVVINAVLLYWVGNLLRDFHVDTFRSAFWGALLISIITVVLNAVTGLRNARIVIHRGQPPKRMDNDGGGRIIDV